jgi:ribose transport system permease protein
MTVAPKRFQRKGASMKKELGILILLLVLCGVLAALNPVFLGADNLRNQARWVGMFGIFSIGIGVVIITGGIELSVGSVFALQGVMLVMMLRDWGLPWPVAAGLLILGSALLGLVHGSLVVGARMQPFIVTLCGLLIYRGLARYISGDTAMGFGTSQYGLLNWLAKGSWLGIPMPFVILMIVAIIMYVLLHRSVYGRYLFAVGRNEDAARYSGISTRLVIGSAYVIAMLLAGVAGIIIAFDTNSISPASHGNIYELYGIAAAVLGGCSLRGGEGSVFGILIGTALIQVLRNFVNLLDIPSSLEYTVMGTVILLGVLVDQVLSQRKRAKVGKPA